MSVLDIESIEFGQRLLHRSRLCERCLLSPEADRHMFVINPPWSTDGAVEVFQPR